MKNKLSLKATKKLTSLFITTSIVTGSIMPTAVVVAEESNLVDSTAHYEDTRVTDTNESKDVRSTQEGLPVTDVVEENVEEFHEASEKNNSTIQVEDQVTVDNGPKLEEDTTLGQNLVDSIKDDAPFWSVEGPTLRIQYDSSAGQNMTDLLEAVTEVDWLNVTSLQVNVGTELTDVDNQALSNVGFFANKPMVTSLDITFLEGSTFQVGDNLRITWCTAFSSNATTFGDNAFFSATSLTEVSAPLATTFGHASFFLATSLTKVSLPNATSFGNSAFSGALNMPNGVTGDMSLTEISLPKATSFGTLAFAYARSLTEISLPNATSFGDSAFLSANSLTEVSLPKATSFGNSAFSGTSSLTEISLPNATTFGYWGFYGAAALIKVSLPKTTSIGGHTPTPNENSFFSGVTSLTSLVIGIPDVQLRNIDRAARQQLKNLTLTHPGKLLYSDGSGSVHLYFGQIFPNLEHFTSNAEVVGDLVFADTIHLKSVDMPNVTTFGTNAFRHNTSLTDVSIPNATTFETNAFQGATALTEISLPKATTFGTNAFQGATSLTDLELGVNESQFINIDSDVKHQVKNLSLTSQEELTLTSPANGLLGFRYIENLTTNTKGLGDNVIRDFLDLKSVTMPNATTFGHDAFSSSFKLTEVSLPNATSFGNSAFSGAITLTEISLPNATSFGNSAFSGAITLTEISLPNATSFGNTAFLNASSLTDVSLPTVTTFGNNAFQNAGWIEHLSLPSVTSVGSNAFMNAKIGVLELPAIETIGALSSQRINSPSIGFIKLNDNPNIRYDELLSSSPNTIGIVNGNTEVLHSVTIGDTVTLSEDSRLFNTENLDSSTWGVRWEKEQQTVSTESSFSIPTIQLTNAGRYSSQIWNKNIPDHSHLSTELSGHQVDVSGELGEVPAAPQVNPVTTRDVVLSGTGELTAEVSVSINGNQIGTGGVDECGNFAIEIEPQAVHTEITVHLRNETGSSDATVVTVTQGAPDAPTVHAVTDIDTVITGTGEAGATLKATVGETTLAVGQAATDGLFELPFTPQVAGTVITVTQSLNDVESAPTSVTVSKTEIVYPTQNEFKLGYWQSYGLILEGQFTNESWDLSSKVGLEGTLQLVDEEGVVKNSASMTLTNWYDATQYNGYQGILDGGMVEALSSGLYEIRMLLTQNGTELANEAIQLPRISGRNGLLQNLTHDFMSLPANHIGTSFVKLANKNQAAHIQIEKDDAPIMGIISEAVMDEGRAVNGFILNTPFDFSQEHQKNLIIETKTADEVAVIENVHTWDLSDWGLGVPNLDMHSGFQIIIPAEFTNTALYQYKMSITAPGDMEEEHMRLVLDKII